MKTFFVVLFGLVALFMGGCGLFFSLLGLSEWESGYGGAMLLFALPSMGFSVLIGWVLWRLTRISDTGPDQSG